MNRPPHRAARTALAVAVSAIGHALATPANGSAEVCIASGGNAYRDPFS